MDNCNILFVCTANICRSTTAEYLARVKFGEDRFRFASAGFMRSGRASSNDLVKVMAKRGIDVTSHRSRTLTTEILEGADLVLVMESQHIQNIAIDSPDHFGKSIPLIEASQRLGGREATVPEFVAELRDRDAMSYLGKEWDVDDPFGRGLRAYKKMVPLMDDLVNTVLMALGA